MSQIILEENLSSNADLLISPILSGEHATMYKNQLQEELDVVDSEKILVNSINALSLLKSPDSNNFFHPQKILCLGKVQSGKTSFFLGTIAYAFDNGYDVAYILAGTKRNLKAQNLERVKNAFSNNDKIKIFDLNTGYFNEDLVGFINKGYKIIILVLKNAAKNKNLGEFLKLSTQFIDIPSLIIDDEGDEFTPGSPRAKRNTKSHDKIAKIISVFKICSFLSITATPQANLLISTIDDLSPDSLVLIQPGKNYIGGNDFFDNLENTNIRIIYDQTDFVDSIPFTFIDALETYIFSCALKRAQGDVGGFSMMVHPSSLKAVQNIVFQRINGYINKLKTNNMSHTQNASELLEKATKFYKEYQDNYGYLDFNSEELAVSINEVLKKIEVKVINSGTTEYSSSNNSPYNIFVGGNMLGRGITINRLIISYIYRDSKVSAVDTMYQRCRWFGYKNDYFDICKVYMTRDLQEKFIAIVSHERNLWLSLESFLETNINIKKFKRIFELNSDDLILTRKSITNTITLRRINTGHSQDLQIDIDKQERKHNIDLFNRFFQTYKHIGKYIDFDNSPEHRQQHFLIRMKFTAFFNEFLKNYIFCDKSCFSTKLFSNIIDEISKKIHEDEILIMIMRPKFCEVRKPFNSLNTALKNLLQGRNVKTEFTGDTDPVDISGHRYSKETFIQIHLVKLDSSWDNKDAFPMLTFNNPITTSAIRIVTGDNVYD